MNASSPLSDCNQTSIQHHHHQPQPREMLGDVECGVMDADYTRIWESFTYWCEGVLMIPVGVVGCLGNGMAVAALLSSKEAKKFSFNHLLVALFTFDLVFTACSVPLHLVGLLGSDEEFQDRGGPGHSWIVGKFFQLLLYPLSTAAYSGGVFMTEAITIDRFLAVVFPLWYHNSTTLSSPRLRALKVILPVVALTVILNLPKLFEMEVSGDEEGNASFSGSELSMDPVLVFWYNKSVLLHPFLTTTAMPIVLICVLNTCIYWASLRARKLRRAGGQQGQQQQQQGETSLLVILLLICSLFVATHSLRLVLSLESFHRAAAISRCLASGRGFVPWLPLVCAEAVSNLLVLCNASLNFAVYFVASTHFRAFVRARLSLSPSRLETIGVGDRRTTGESPAGAQQEDGAEMELLEGSSQRQNVTQNESDTRSQEV